MYLLLLHEKSIKKKQDYLYSILLLILQAENAKNYRIHLFLV